MQFWTVDEILKQHEHDHQVGEEIAPGVTVTRRSVLRFGMTAAGLALFGGLSGCASTAKPKPAPKPVPKAPQKAMPKPEPGPANVDEFLTFVLPKARALIASASPDEEVYLKTVSEQLTGLKAPPRWRKSVFRNGKSMDHIAFYPPVIFLQVEMAPFAIIDLHDHRHYNGILTPTKGDIRCRNFDIVQPDGKTLDIAAGEVPPKGETFLIRETSNVFLDPGQLSTLSRDRDNIHHVQAGPDGATLLDLFTHFNPNARSYSLDWDGKAFDEKKKLYKVAWKS